MNYADTAFFKLIFLKSEYILYACLQICRQDA